MNSLGSEDVIHQRQTKAFNFIKSKADWVIYVALAVIVWIGVWIRTRNLPGLRDVTTGGWTLGPDLDPFLFLRYAKDIVAQGTLYAIDTMRYVPLGIETKGFLLHYYSIAWFHKIASIFGSGSVEQSAVLYPVFMFALTAIAFFLLSRRILRPYLDSTYSSIAALVSTLFFSILPVFIPRTIAGIPEKESAAFLFMFLALYFFIISWSSHTLRRKVIFGVCAGLSTGIMALIWGAYSYIFFIIIPAVFLSFLFGNFERKHIWAYISWLLSAVIIMVLFSNRYGIKTAITSFDRGVALALLACVAFYHFVWPKISHRIANRKYLSYIPTRLLSLLLCGLVLVVLISILEGPSFIFNRIGEMYSSFIRPASTRLIQTVAENRQPYLTEWLGNFGPYVFKIFISFWLFLIGSFMLFWSTLRNFDRKERIRLTASFVFMIFAILFSRYSAGSVLNGDNTISLILYALGIFGFIFMIGKSYFSADKKSEMSKFKEIPFEVLLLFSFLFISLISARGFIRLVMIVVPPASIAIGYLAASSIYSIRENINLKRQASSFIVAGILLLAILFSAYQLSRESYSLSTNYVPSVYTQQWQKAMAWVRDNTPTNAVFGHWWDYGYWVQSMGERATVLDGGNDISYWNHLMGRYALTESDFTKTLDFLYAHNTTHFLIDPTDIGKYSAFSTIGSNSDYDRRSWIPTFVRDESQKQQRKNSTIEVYAAGTLIDEDITYEFNGTRVFLPANAAALGGILVEISSEGSILNVNGYYVYGDKNYVIPLRYYYDSSLGLIDFGKGIESGVFVYPKVDVLANGQANIDRIGTLLYLSPRTIKTNVANYYLFNKPNPNFKLVHAEDDIIVETLRAQGLQLGEFVYYNGLRGPIKIWEITYPRNMALNQSYLEVDYPDAIRLA